MFDGQRLKQLRQTKQWAQAEIARQLGISRSSYFNWEAGKTQPNQDNLTRLEELFGVESDYFDQSYPIYSVYHQLYPTNQERLIQYGEQLLTEQQTETGREQWVAYHVYEKLSAGTGYGYFEERSYDTVYYDRDIPHDLASWVYGDSMEPQYENGSVVLIRDTGFDFDGEVYAVDWDGQTYVKRVYRESEALRLVSDNPKYQDKFAPYSEEPRIIGKVIGHFMPLGGEGYD